MTRNHVGGRNSLGQQARPPGRDHLVTGGRHHPGIPGRNHPVLDGRLHRNRQAGSCVNSQRARRSSTVRLSDGTVTLSYGTTGATPNANQVGSSLASSAARAGLKTIVFVNQADHAPATADRIRAGLPAAGALTAAENDLWQDVIAELGGPEHSLINPAAAALPHNGDMTAVERRLAESIFRRRDGASVIVATPTLAQGMNLPAEVAILAGTMRHDDDGREPLRVMKSSMQPGERGEPVISPTVPSSLFPNRLSPSRRMARQVTRPTTCSKGFCRRMINALRLTIH